MKGIFIIIQLLLNFGYICKYKIFNGKLKNILFLI